MAVFLSILKRIFKKLASLFLTLIQLVVSLLSVAIGIASPVLLLITWIMRLLAVLGVFATIFQWNEFMAYLNADPNHIWFVVIAVIVYLVAMLIPTIIVAGAMFLCEYIIELCDDLKHHINPNSEGKFSFFLDILDSFDI